MHETIRFESTGPAVVHLAELLEKHGCGPNPPVDTSNPVFDRAVENMVLYFQMTHQDRHGNWLDVDGIVGSGTWWALENATGDAQRSFLEAGIPAGIDGERRKILEMAVKQHGVREDPGRPNRGSEVDKFIPPETLEAAPPWCCYFASWVTRQVFGEDPVGKAVASCYKAYQHALSLGRWEPNDGRVPTPGDAFVILHEDPESVDWCTGHIGFVLQVAEDGKSINTVEGNCGNRVKIGRRVLADPKLRGFINIVGDHPEFDRGSLRGAKDVGGSGTR